MVYNRVVSKPSQLNNNTTTWLIQKLKNIGSSYFITLVATIPLNNEMIIPIIDIEKTFFE